MDNSKKNNQEKSSHPPKEKKQDWPKVLLKRFDDGKIAITGRVKQPQENASSSHSKVEKKKESEAAVIKKSVVKQSSTAKKDMELNKGKNTKKSSSTHLNRHNNNDEATLWNKAKLQDKSSKIKDTSSIILKKNARKPECSTVTSKNFHSNDSVIEKLDKIIDLIIPGNETLLNQTIMEELLNETTKLKASKTTKIVHLDKLLNILNIMEINIKKGGKLLFNKTEVNNNNTEKILITFNACLVCLNIMTSTDMPKRIYLEDIINETILSIKNQLENIIFPTFNDETKQKLLIKIPKDTIKILYNKSLISINLLTEFINIQVLTNSLILEVTSMAANSFFIENINDKLQPACLKLITTIFTRYDKQRKIVLEQVLALGFHKPNIKQKLATDNICAVTVLALQLIQCVTIFPEDFIKDGFHNLKSKKTNKDSLIYTKYEVATSTAGTFLTIFLNHCKSDNMEHKLLFEYFIKDLILIVNNPKWPTSVLLLNLLGRILVAKLSDKEAELHSRIISLDYLSLIMVWLRNVSILIENKKENIENIIKKIKSVDKKKETIKCNEEKIEFLQEILLEYLAESGKNHQISRDALHFYVAQWYNKTVDQIIALFGKQAENKINKSTQKGDTAVNTLDKKATDAYIKLQTRKKILLNKLQYLKGGKSIGIDCEEAKLVAQYLFSGSFPEYFDKYLKAILIVLKDPSTIMRTKTIKCLSIIISADPSLLIRNDIKMGINYLCHDQELSVREAALDLIGSFILTQPQLLDQYYQILSARILDTSTGVRKKVIKILRDICISQPDFIKIPEIYVKIIRRVADDGGVGKLVVDIFTNMWFNPALTSISDKATNIVNVVAASNNDHSLQFFEKLLENIFKPKKEDNFNKNLPKKSVLIISKQIIDCLIENITKLQQSDETNRKPLQLSYYIKTLLVFTKIKPQLLINNVKTIQTLLNLKTRTKEDIEIISDSAQILSLTVALIPNPDHIFLAQLEGNCLRLVLQDDRPIVISSLSCLASIINNLTHNFNIIKDCFDRYYSYMAHIKLRILTDDSKKTLMEDIRHRQYLKRGLFIVGLLFRHFDFTDEKVIGKDLPNDIVEQVFGVFLFFLQQNDEDIQSNTIKAVRSICTRHHEFMLEKHLKTFYQCMLKSEDAPLAIKSEILINIEAYLIEEDQRLLENDLKCKNHFQQIENVDKPDDVSSGMASTVIQQYLKEILESYLNPNIQVRTPALRVVQLILEQGLVHPVQIAPFLICMSTDCEKMVSHGADKRLLELEQKYPGLIHTKSLLGVQLSYRLQKILQNTVLVRGFRLLEEGEYPNPLHGYLYSLIQDSRQQRRALLLNMLKQFDEEQANLSYMLYLADNIAYFPYTVQDEPLFIIHHINMMISVSGTNLLQSFKEGLINTMEVQCEKLESVQNDYYSSALDDEADVDKEALLARLPEDTSKLQAYLTAAQGCLLLLMLKQHLKDVYGLNDGKIRNYSPIESVKLYEKPISHRIKKLFNPITTINRLQEDSSFKILDEEGRKNLINEYLEFKQLMLKLDCDEKYDLKASNSLNNPSTSASATIWTEPNNNKSVTKKRKSRTSQPPSKRRSKTPKRKKKYVISSDEEMENDSSDSDFVP